MIRWLACAIALLLPALASAQAPEGQVRATLGTSGRIWTGQKVVLVIELLAPGYFTGNPTFDLPRLPGILVMPPAGSPAVSNESIGGTEYTVQRHELLVYPQKDGAVSIPPFEVRFNFKRQPLDHDSIPQKVKSQAVSFEVARPPGAPPGTTILTSSDLDVMESWKPEPGAHAKVGDAFVRTITWSATDLTGMAFPPLKPQPIAGLGLYPGEPLVEDTADRGELHGQRTDTVTYVVKTGGHFEIPAATIQWWDPKAGAMKSKTLPGHAFDVPQPPVPPMPLSARIGLFWGMHHRTILTVLAAAAAALAGFRMSRRFWKRLYRDLHPRRLGPLNPP